MRFLVTLTAVTATTIGTFKRARIQTGPKLDIQVTPAVERDEPESPKPKLVHPGQFLKVPQARTYKKEQPETIDRVVTAKKVGSSEPVKGIPPVPSVDKGVAVPDDDDGRLGVFLIRDEDELTDNTAALGELMHFYGVKQKDIEQDYDFGKRLSSGEYGAVYEGKNKQTGEVVAIKHDFDEDVEATIREVRAAYLLRHLDHPAFPRIYDVYYLYDQLDVVMELIQGRTFSDMIEEDEITLSQIKWVIREVVKAIDYLHEHRIAHNDLHTGNIIVSGERVRIIDFGMHTVRGSEVLVWRDDWALRLDVHSIGMVAMTAWLGEEPDGSIHELMRYYTGFWEKDKKGRYRANHLHRSVPKSPPKELRGCPPELIDFVATCLDPGTTTKSLLQHPFLKAKE